MYIIRMKTITYDSSPTRNEGANTEEGTPLQRKVSLSTPFEGLFVSRINSGGY